MTLPIIDLLGRPLQDAISLLGPVINDPAKQLEPGERVYLEFPAKGVSLILDDEDDTFCIQLYGHGIDEGYECFQGDLLGGLRMSSTCADARAALGEPVRSAHGAAGKGLFGRYLYAWDKYVIDSCEYHFEYTENLDRLRLVSIERASGGDEG